MTYGWMLLVVAVVGGAIFSVVQSQSVESVSGFTGGDVTVDDFGVTSDGNLQLILRNSAGESVEVTGIEISGNGNTAEWSDSQSIGVGETGSVTLNSVEEGDGANSLDVEVFYDVGGLENLSVSGTISGNFEVVSDSINYGLTADYSVNDSSPEPGDAVEFTSTSSPVSEISGYSWSSPDTTLDESSGESIVHVFGEGSYEVNLTVSDGLGNESSYSSVVDVSSSSVSPEDFQLSGVSDNGPVTEADTVNVDYTVSNNGDVSGSQDITLDVEGVQEDVNSDISLNSGDSTTGSLSWVTESGDAGSGIGYTVSTENDSVSGSVDVQSGSVSVSGAPSFSTAPIGAQYESSWVPVTSSSSVQNGFDYFFDETNDEEYYNVSEGFYVMKYEAKPYNNDSDNFDGGTGEVGDSTVYVPRSVAANKPWRDISFYGGSPINGYGAVQACEALDSQTSEFDVHLVTNREWMTVARQIEQTDSNWVGGSVDSSGQLIRGNSDGSAPYRASTDDSQGFYNLASGENSDYNERTFDLANGQTVWDWAGNVRHWVYAEDSGGSTTYGVFDSAVATDGTNDPAKEYEYDPAVVDRSTDGVGGESGFGYQDAAVRGGSWIRGDNAGVFRASSYNPSLSTGGVGFRCSAVPVS